MKDLYRILSLGAGVQSTTLLLMSCRGVLPQLDAAIFADTQWEPAAVYKHLDWLTGKAADSGIPVYRVTAGNLREDALEFRRNPVSAEGKRYASIPVFVKNPDGSQGIVRRQCTKEYKIEPVEQCIRRTILGMQPKQRVPKGVMVEHWFGISWDELYRMSASWNKWEKFRYPLIEDCDSIVADQLPGIQRGFTRDDCLAWMNANGYPKPPRSACIGCPFHSDDEWHALTAGEFADAVQFDKDMRVLERPIVGKSKALTGEPYLHRQMVPLDMVEFKGGPGKWNHECSGRCHT